MRTRKRICVATDHMVHFMSKGGTVYSKLQISHNIRLLRNTRPFCFPVCGFIVTVLCYWYLIRLSPEELCITDWRRLPKSSGNTAISELKLAIYWWQYHHWSIDSIVQVHGNHTPGSRSYSDPVDTWANFFCIHHLVLKPCSTAACITLFPINAQ